MLEICDYGDFYDYIFPGKGRHHKTVYVPKCINIAKLHYGNGVIRCYKHKNNLTPKKVYDTVV